MQVFQAIGQAAVTGLMWACMTLVILYILSLLGVYLFMVALAGSEVYQWLRSDRNRGRTKGR